MGDDALRAAQSPTLPEQPEDHLTLQEAAAELSLNVAELQFALRANSLIVTPHFGRNLVSRSELESYRLRNTPAPEATTHTSHTD